MIQSDSQRSMSKIYMKAVIQHLQQNKGLDESQATQLFEKYYRPVYKHWGMEPNAEEFAEKIQEIDELACRIGKGVKSLKTIDKNSSSIDKEELIRLIIELPEEKLLRVYEYVKKINTLQNH
ncbi:hypothetical protein [Paenibacillus rhizolycopersici]|uniref:hypothetical protein n=1 Tax=Paenibacillus rhizolycopersici TaxID=2780073 RepID=UPI003D2D2093